MRQLRVDRFSLPAALLCIVILALIEWGDDQPTQFEQVLQRGTLTILTRNGAST